MLNEPPETQGSGERIFMTDEPVVDETVDEPENVDVLDPQMSDDAPSEFEQDAAMDIDQIARTDAGDPA